MTVPRVAKPGLKPDALSRLLMRDTAVRSHSPDVRVWRDASGVVREVVHEAEETSLDLRQKHVRDVRSRYAQCS
jgi:hypothetical protein